MQKIFLISMVLTMAASEAALGHHSRARFDADSIVAIQGTVTKFNWSNPHVYIEIEEERGTGEAKTWEIETDAIPILLRSGWNATALTVGERVLVRANPGNADNANHGLLVSVAKQDGTLLLPRAHFERDLAPARATARASSLAGVWELPFGETGDFMQRWGRIGLTPKGQAGKDAFTPEDRPAGKCIQTPSPMLMAMPYLNEIAIEEDRVILRSEFLNAERIVYTDGRPHPGNLERTIQGHSIGRWEGATLVVDTVGFADHAAPIRGPNEGVPSGARKHVVERYTLSEDGTRITIDFEVEDDEYLTEPFTGSLEWVYLPDFEISGLGCEPESY